jgi:site-specific recombinase XerD
MVVIPFPKQPARAPVCPPLADVVALFLIDLRLDGRASGTIAKHLQEFRRYGRWLDEEALSWAAVTPSDIGRFARTRVAVGSSARGATYCSLRLLYAWAATEGLLRGDRPTEDLHTPQRGRPQPKTLKQAHIRQLIAYVAAQQGLRARRDEALVITAVYTGLRAAELSRLRWGDVDLDADVITIWISKMNHGRVVPIHPQLKLALVAWQTLQALGSNAPVFGDTHRDSTVGRAITPGRVGKIVKAVARATNLPLTAHVLRHTFATWTLRKSKDLYAVSKALGHAALKQTEIYVSAEIDQIAAAVATLPALDAW